MIEWWLGRHSSSMRSGLCVELWSGHGETKSQSVVNVPNACFNVEAVIEIEGFKVGPKRSHVALRHLRIERSKSRSSSSSSSSSEPFAATDFELALVFDKPGQYTVPITDITRIRCKYLQQGKASIEAKGALVLLNAVCQGDLERLLLLIRDVKTGKTPVESRPCVVCREKGYKVKHKREELQSSVLDCIFRKRQLLHVSPGQDQVLKQLRDLKNRDHVQKSKKMGLSPGESDDRAYVLDREVFEAGSKFEDRFQDEMRHYGRENSGSRQSPPAYLSRSGDGQDSKTTSPTTARVHADERSRRVSEDVRRRERPGTWSGSRREREALSPEGEGKENFKGEEEVRKIGEETVRRLADERRRAEEEKRRVLEEQRRRAEEEHRRVQEEQRKKYEEERRRREELRRLEEEERRQAEERERKSQDDRRRKEEKENQKEELRRFVEEQERKRREDKERRALEEERRRKDEEERILQELRRQKQEEERLRKELERRVQEQEQLRKQEEERRRKEEEDQRLLESRRQKEEDERQKREQERRLQEQVLEVRRRQEEEKKKQEALRRQRQEEERLLQERRKREELRRQKLEEQSKRLLEEERRHKQEAAAAKAQEDSKMRVVLEEERKKLEEIRRRVLEEQRDRLEQRRLDEEMRQWQREEDHRRTREDQWSMSDEERARLEEQRHRVGEVMKMTRDLARKRLEENVKEEEKRRHAQEKELQDEEICRQFLDDDKRTLDEDIQKLVDKASNVASLEEVLMKLKERCSFRSGRDSSDNVENSSPTSTDHTKGMSYLFTRLEEKKKALKEEQERVRREEARLNLKPENFADSQAKAEKQRQEEMKRHEVERKRAEKAANTLKKKLLQEQLRAAKLEARRLERVRKEAEKQAKAEERAKQQQRAHEQARKQAQEQARQFHYPSAPQRWPSYNHRPLTYQEYEESWNVMNSSRKGPTLGYADIPWPPAGNPLFIESGDTFDVQKRKLRIALLRWHPDKFMAICGDRLGSVDRESIETQAKHLAQQVIQWKSRLEQA
ncbi:hypothetical protein Mapa_002925 [Marchantia paleacea]|nr:hypothetical protein Mapa_002925 [Marchantia paleacea]